MTIFNSDKLAEPSANSTRAEFHSRNELVTLEQLCALVGRTPQSIRRWENGAEPTFPKARFIAKRKYWLRSEIEHFLRNLPHRCDGKSCVSGQSSSTGEGR
jgi:predicted DNA-binding transcriptional regulator AlpA